MAKGAPAPLLQLLGENRHEGNRARAPHGADCGFDDALVRIVEQSAEQRRGGIGGRGAQQSNHRYPGLVGGGRDRHADAVRR